MTVETTASTITSIEPDLSLQQVSNVKDWGIIRFQDAALGVLTHDLQQKCRNCGLCGGVKNVNDNGSIELDTDNGKLPVLLKRKCKLPKNPVFVNMNHLVTKPAWL